jgi:hypothetical protein
MEILTTEHVHTEYSVSLCIFITENLPLLVACLFWYAVQCTVERAAKQMMVVSCRA